MTYRQLCEAVRLAEIAPPMSIHDVEMWKSHSESDGVNRGAADAEAGKPMLARADMDKFMPILPTAGDHMKDITGAFWDGYQRGYHSAVRTTKHFIQRYNCYTKKDAEKNAAMYTRNGYKNVRLGKPEQGQYGKVFPVYGTAVNRKEIPYYSTQVDALPPA